MAQHAGAAQGVYFDVNNTDAQSGVVDGGTYSWEAAVWNTSIDGSSATPGLFPADTPGNAGFPRFAAGGSSSPPPGVVGDAVGSYTVTANANHLIAGMFQEDGSVGSTLTLNGTGVISIDTGVQGFITRGQSNLKIFNKLSGPGGVSFQSNNSFASTGNGSLFLYGDNDYAGGTDLATSGGMNINSSHSLGTGPIKIASSPAATSATLVDVDATAPIILTNSFSWRTAIASTLTVVSPPIAPIEFIGPVTLATTAAITSTLTVGNSNFPNTLTTISGVISGAGNFTKNQSGTLVLTGANTYTGITTSFGGGVLSISSDGNLGAVPASPVANAITLAGATTGGTLRATATFATDVNRGVTLMPGQPATGDALGGTVDVTAGNTLTVNGIVAGVGKLTKTGPGTLALANANTFTGAATVSAGTLVVANGDALSGAAGAGVALSVADAALARAQAGLTKAVTVSTLATNTSGKFDITNNSMVVKGMNVTQVEALVKTGFNAGHWNGSTGLVSTTAETASPAITAIGVANAGVLQKTTFKGVNTATTDTLVKYTYYGDSDLSGATTLDDFTLFLGGYQTAGSTWFVGDYNYSGTVTLDDFNLFLAGYQQQGAPLSEIEALINSLPDSAERAELLAAVHAIPEPTGLALLGVAGAGLLGRRARRQA